MLRPILRRALTLLILIGLVTIAAPALLPSDPLRQSLADALAPPGTDHLLGTDHLGRSLLARLVAGARYSLGIAAIAVAAALLVGGLLGVVGAMAGAVVRRATATLIDVTIALPAFLVALLLAGTTRPGAAGLGLVIAATAWVEPARVAFLTTRQALDAPAVEAARLAGLPSGAVATRLVLPALAGPFASLGGLMFGQAILTVATLGFLGLGLRPPTPEWGAMIVDALPYVAEAPLLLIAPALAITATVAALFLVTTPPPATEPA